MQTPVSSPGKLLDTACHLSALGTFRMSGARQEDVTCCLLFGHANAGMEGRVSGLSEMLSPL